MRLALVLLLAASVAAVSTAAATAAPARTTKLTPAEQKWVRPMVAVWNNMNTRLQQVQGQLVAKEALLVGTRANLTLNITLANFVDCAAKLRKAGKPPARLAPVNTSMTAACGRFKAGSLLIARGIGEIRKARQKAGVGHIQTGIGELKKGTTQLAKARRQLTTISAQNPNAR
jgi:hypothetical protein